jgi:hypothetical protein
MSRTIDLKRLERKAYLSYHQDGLLDIALGLWIFLLGTSMGAGKPVLIVLVPMFILGLAGAKKAITIPRIGYVKFGPARQKEAAAAGILVGVVLLPIVLIGILILRGYITLPPEWMAWAEEYFMSGFAVVGGGLMGALAFLLGIRRLYAYAALILVVSVVGYLLHTTAPPLFVMIAGALIMLCGLVVLVRFVRKYPIVAEEVGEIDH